MPDLMRQGQAQRRRGGAPSSTLMAAAPPPPPPGAHDIIASAYHAEGGWMDAAKAQQVMSSVDQMHGAGVGKSAHTDLIAQGVIRKQRARSTTYHWSA